MRTNAFKCAYHLYGMNCANAREWDRAQAASLCKCILAVIMHSASSRIHSSIIDCKCYTSARAFFRCTKQLLITVRAHTSSPNLPLRVSKSDGIRSIYAHRNCSNKCYTNKFDDRRECWATKIPAGNIRKYWIRHQYILKWLRIDSAITRDSGPKRVHAVDSLNRVACRPARHSSGLYSQFCVYFWMLSAIIAAHLLLHGTFFLISELVPSGMAGCFKHAERMQTHRYKENGSNECVRLFKVLSSPSVISADGK